MINIKSLYKEFKHNKVINNFNLNVEKGEKVLIKGRNGCGKSTLLKIIGGLIEADKGTITIEEPYNIGALIENPCFIEFRTLAFNLQYLYNLKSKYDEKSVRKLCERFSLDLDSSIKMKDYSIGMRQKAGIIQAFMENQNIILLDEPTRGMDEESVQQFCELIKQSNMKTIIIAAHDGVDEIKFDKIVSM